MSPKSNFRLGALSNWPGIITTNIIPTNHTTKVGKILQFKITIVNYNTKLQLLPKITPKIITKNYTENYYQKLHRKLLPKITILTIIDKKMFYKIFYKMLYKRMSPKSNFRLCALSNWPGIITTNIIPISQ